MCTVHNLADYRPPPTETPPPWLAVAADAAVQSILNNLDGYHDLRRADMAAFHDEMRDDIAALISELVEVGLGRSLDRVAR